MPPEGAYSSTTEYPTAAGKNAKVLILYVSVHTHTRELHENVCLQVIAAGGSGVPPQLTCVSW